ncbi:unnamed protein product [Urochloa decumbens]|uniref:F-box domain-containing protein n=1 Tax=Urochloa decumbens TaxID=240449 RepID=A0ABC9DGE7_9POAL
MRRSVTTAEGNSGAAGRNGQPPAPRGGAERALVAAATEGSGTGRDQRHVAAARAGPARSLGPAASAGAGVRRGQRRPAAVGGGADDAGGERDLGAAAEGSVTGHGIGAPPLLASVSAVLGNGDLLRQILLRVGLPNYLVRASLVSKRWYLCASDPAFLRCFRDLHPPIVLGFYVELRSNFHRQDRTRFVPRPPPNELDALVRRSIFSLDMGIFEEFEDCWNGCILTYSYNGHTRRSMEYTVRWPLDHARGTLHLPLPPDNIGYYYGEIFPGRDDRLLFFCLAMRSIGQQSVADVYKLSEDGVWAIYISATIDISGTEPYATLFVDNKIYMLANMDMPVFAILDLASTSFTAVDLPEDVDGEGESYSMMSLVDDSVCLILVRGFQIHVWTHKANNEANWMLLNSICLHKMCGDQIMSTCSSVELCRGGAKAEFVLLQMGGAVYFLDIRREVIEKGYEVALEAVSLRCMFPFLIVWAPVFPVIKQGRDQKE